MEIVSEWKGRNPDDYRQQIDDERARQTRASGYADIELADIPGDDDDEDGVHKVYEAGDGGGGGGGPSSRGKESGPRKRKEPKMMTVQNRVLRAELGILGLLTVLLIFVMLLFMAYPYRDEPDKYGAAFSFAPAMELPPDALFVGHVNPSTTCYCAAWAASEFYGGRYALPGEPSPETAYVIDHFGFHTPPQFSDEYDPAFPLVLMNHNQASQSPPYAYDRFPDIEGIIDSHGIQDDFISSTSDDPLSLDMRSWGSTATIIVYQFYDRHKTPSKELARCLISSIYSDTVGLQGPTTTDHDRRAAELLTPLAKTNSRKDLTVNLINSRVPPSDTSFKDVLNINAKTYQLSWRDGSVITLRWSTFNTGDPDYILEWKPAFLKEMRRQKEEDKLDFYFLSVVNELDFFEDDETDGISTLLLPSKDERNAAEAVYGGNLRDEGTSMDVSPMMSRKAEFLPPLDFFFRESKPFDWDRREL